MPIEHIVWDLDGTLVDSRVDIADAVNFALTGLQCDPLPLDTIVSFVGDGVAALVERAVRAAGAPSGSQQRALDLLERHYESHLLEKTRFYTGIPEILDHLAASDVKLSVLTNKKEAYSLEILEGLGKAGLFGRVIGGDSGWGLKPEPDGLLAAIEDSGTAASSTWMIGDSEVDMATAASAGVAGLGAGWGFNSHASLQAAGACKVLDAPQDLVQLLVGSSSATASTSSISDAKVKSI